MSYRVHAFDYYGDGDGRFYTLTAVLHVPDKPTLDDVRKELIRLELMAEDWPADDVVLQVAGDEIFVNYGDGRQAYKLVPEGRRKLPRT